MSVNRAFANRFLTHKHTLQAVEQTVEWAYAFDVHCNSFFPLFLMLYIAQFFLMRVLIKDIWICLFLGNTMYLIAIGYYCYITFLGYNGKLYLNYFGVNLFYKTMLKNNLFFSITISFTY